MKATRTLGFWKALAFLTVIFSLFFLVGCSDTPTVETVQALSRDGGTTIEATGKIISDGGEEIWDKGFCISQHPNPTISDTKRSVSEMSAIFSANLNGLDKNVTYYVRAYAENSVGVGYGAVVEVYTSALALAQTGDAEVLGNTEAILYGNVDDQNSDQVDTWFEVWREGESTKRVEVQKTGTQSATEIFANVSGLTPGELYYYVVKAQNATGTVTGETKTFRLYYEQVTDYDGNKYWTVKIGNQIWLESNLRTKHFLNGDPIPNVQPDAEWVAMKSPAWCYTKNDPKLGEVYGCLYNNYVGLDSRGLIEGYRTPTIYDCEELVAFNGGGTMAARKLKSATDDWFNGRKGDNSSGFNALPGGWRDDKSTPFSTLYYQATFQTTTLMEGVGVFYSAIIYGSNRDVMTAGANFQYVGYSIRLIKN